VSAQFRHGDGKATRFGYIDMASTHEGGRRLYVNLTCFGEGERAFQKAPSICLYIRPTYPSVFSAQSKHDNSPTVVLPDKPPEIVFGRRQWTLSCYIFALGVVALTVNQKYRQ